MTPPMGISSTTIIAITLGVLGSLIIAALLALICFIRKKQQAGYLGRCRPINQGDRGFSRLWRNFRDSMRSRKSFAAIKHNALNVQDLGAFAEDRLAIFEEFSDIPDISPQPEEVPDGCESKNRYANIVPLNESRVLLKRLEDDPQTEYINANYVRLPSDSSHLYIACQAPLESTIADFWRMIWEQQSRVIIQATDLIESGIEKCAEYLPPSMTMDYHSTYGHIQVTLQNREVMDKYAKSTVQLKNISENKIRQLTHYWFNWPETGVPEEQSQIIAMLLEARTSLISYAAEQKPELKKKSSRISLRSAEEGKATASGSVAANDADATLLAMNSDNSSKTNKTKKTSKNMGPLTVHCSPGTGRTGTIIACDMAMRSLDAVPSKRIVDIPQILCYIRQGRAGAVQTKEQYEFIYKVATMYATQITNPSTEN